MARGPHRSRRMTGVGRLSYPEKRWTLPWDPTAASVARRHVADACVGLPADTVDVARLLVTELVTNAVRHGEGPMALVIGRDGTDLRVEVHDGSPTMPAVIAESASLRDHGAGLRLVETLSSEWGFAPFGDGNPGKSVWFALR